MKRLNMLLQYNNRVCSTEVGCTGVLKHKVFFADEVPVDQRPYWFSPPKQTFLGRASGRDLGQQFHQTVDH